MTRAQEPDSEIDYRVEGIPGATRAVVVLRTGALATIDPDVAETARHGARVVLVHLEGPELEDPPAFGGETPAASTLRALRKIVDEVVGEAPFAVVGEGEAGALALSLAADLGGRVDRLALVAVPVPTGGLDRDLAADVISHITARTTVIDVDAEAAAWHAERLRDARVDLVASHDLRSPDGRCGLSDTWSLVLAHCVPAQR